MLSDKYKINHSEHEIIFKKLLDKLVSKATTVTSPAVNYSRRSTWSRKDKINI
jgi:hypothetical protein